MRDFEFEGEDNFLEAMDYMVRAIHDEEQGNAGSDAFALNLQKRILVGFDFSDLRIVDDNPLVQDSLSAL